jgi:hypothetical protein
MIETSTLEDDKRFLDESGFLDVHTLGLFPTVVLIAKSFSPLPPFPFMGLPRWLHSVLSTFGRRCALRP